LLTPLWGRIARLRLSLYADDAVVFINPVKEDVDVLMEIMHKFREATGLGINVHKSSVVPIRCSQIDLDDVLQNFGGARTTFPISYLGLPITVNRPRISHLQYVLDPASKKLQGWQADLLNIGGRKELVKTVLGALPTYLLTAIKPPKRFYKEMDKLRRRFLWAGTQRMHGGKCKVNWQRVCRPMNRGGLGISDLGKIGRALRLRWIWGQWKSPDKAWCGSELPTDSIDEALFAVATKVTVHNGSTAKFWQSSWLHGSSPAMMFPSLFQHSKRKNRSVKEALHNENWIRHDMSPALLAQYVMFWTLVDGMSFNSNDTTDDEIVWWRTGDGNYSARSAYELQFEGSHLSTFPSLVWKIWAPAHCKFFTWLVL
jgi:hypothetical protein